MSKNIIEAYVTRSTTQWVIRQVNGGTILKTFPIASKSEGEVSGWIQRNGMQEVRFSR